MNFETLLTNLIGDTTGGATGSLRLFAPELAVCATIVALLLARLFGVDRRLPSYWVALAGVLVAFWFAFREFMSLGPLATEPRVEFFTGLLVYDQFTIFLRLFLLLFLVLVITLTVLSGIPDNEDGPDFFTLLLGSAVGMMLMASANHLLILFLGVEMASVPSYAMVAFQKGRRQSSEAALKFVVYGAGAAGVMLYGTSLLAGLLGTAELPEVAGQLRLLLTGPGGLTDPAVRTVLLAALMVMVGLAFKLSLFPFHFWCPDAFHGASAEVAGYLSVASKAAAFALLVRFLTAFVPAGTVAAANLNLYLGIGLGVIAAVTMTFGNLAAYAQSNVKRLLAYSTIAHAGYMLGAVAALMVILSAPGDAGFDRAREATRAVAGLLFYLTVYLFMNLGAFAIVALIRNRTFSEEIDDYAGLVSQAPALCVGMLICVFSLVGLPPLGGFFGKWYIFTSLFQAGKLHWSMWAVLVVAGLNTVFSLFYYIRILKAMFIAPRPAGARRAEVPVASLATVYVVMVAGPVLLFGMHGRLIGGLSRRAQEVASGLFVARAADGQAQVPSPGAAPAPEMEHAWLPRATTPR